MRFPVDELVYFVRRLEADRLRILFLRVVEFESLLEFWSFHISLVERLSGHERPLRGVTEIRQRLVYLRQRQSRRFGFSILKFVDGRLCHSDNRGKLRLGPEFSEPVFLDRGGEGLFGNHGG